LEEEILPKVVILFSGAGTNMAYILEKLQGVYIDVVLALTDNPNAKGIDIARSNNIPYQVIEPKDYVSREAYDEILVKRIQEKCPKLVFLAGFMRILTPIFTDKIEAINLHPSLLPKHKGLRAIEKSYQDESSKGGVSVHWVSSELDGGEVIAQIEVSKNGLSFDEYRQKIRAVEKIAFVEAIKKVLNGDVL
jgi:phosphoribosylglycinamide formyltransferase-1